MGSKGIEFVSTQDVTMKSENTYEDPFCNQSWISSIPDQISDKKCGEIFTVNYDQLRFVCVFCNGSYDKICDFGFHLRQHEFKISENLESNLRATEVYNEFDVESISGGQSTDETTAISNLIEEISCDESDVLFKSTIDLLTQDCSNPGNTETVEFPSLVKAYECKLCKKEYRNARMLAQHICRSFTASITKKATSDHVCSVCKKQYSNASKLSHHSCRGLAASTPDKDVSDNVCSVSKKKYANKKSLKSRGVVPTKENASDHITNSKSCGSAAVLIDTVVESHAVSKAVSETNCRNFSLGEQLENSDGLMADSDTKGEKNCKDPRELSPKIKFDKLVNVLDKDKIELIKCKVCNELLEPTESMNRHKCLQTTKKYQCTSANDSNTEVTLVGTTKRKKNSKNSKIMTNPDLYCDICKKQLHLKHAFRKHGMMHADPPSAMRNMPDYLKCKYCGEKVVKHSDWLPHERTHSNKVRHICPYCSKEFKRLESFKCHINIHTGERPYKCDQCPASFAHSSNLLIHKRRIHLKHHPHACSDCPVKCVSRSELRQHMKVHTGDRAHQCEVCGKSFTTATTLSVHIRIHSGIKNVKCPLCPMLFIHKKRLAGHMVKHSNEKRYKCDVCGDKFSRSRSLRIHKKLHLPEKEYVCPICGKAFAQFAGLYSHKKSHREVDG